MKMEIASKKVLFHAFCIETKTMILRALE